MLYSLQELTVVSEEALPSCLVSTCLKLYRYLILKHSPALEGADLTLHSVEEEAEELKEVERIIHEKTGGKRKIATATLDLRNEMQCRQLVAMHLEAHGDRLDTM